MEYRLNKYISSSGICSRRDADRYIEQGNVTVNGKKAIVGMRILPGQIVKVNGQLVETDIKPAYIALNKPIGIVCTTDTTEKDNVIDFVCHEQRIFPIGRLDKDSQGLILLTNDGDIVNKILRAGNNHRKEYIVTVDSPITDDFLTKMSQGVPILDRVTRKCQLKQITPFIFQITLTQGLNRQIRRMCEYFNYQVIKLERTQVLNVKLGNLKQGEWRNLSLNELDELFDLIEDSEKAASSKQEKAEKSKIAAKNNNINNNKSNRNTISRSSSNSYKSSSNTSGRSQRNNNKTKAPRKRR